MKSVFTKSIVMICITFIVSILTETQSVSKPISKGKDKKITMKLWGTSYNQDFGRKNV